MELVSGVWKGKIVYLNNAALRIMGFEDLSEVIGSPVFNYVTSQEDVAVIMQMLLENGSWEGELNVKKYDGTPIRIHLYATVVYDENGEPLCFMDSFVDISLRKQMEEDLKRSVQKYKSLYSMMRLMCDNVPDMIWAKNLEKKYVFANKAICRKLLIADHMDEPIGKDDMYFALRERNKYPENPHWHDFGEICKDTDSIVMENRKADRFDEYGNVQGNFLFLDVYKAPFFDEQGTMIGTVGCGRDITRQKQIEKEKAELERKLRQSQKMEAVGTLAGGIAHDFNNILTAIIGFSEVILGDVEPDSDLEYALREILSAGHRAKELVNQILTFARQTEQELKPTRVDILVKEALKLIRSTFPSTIVLEADIQSQALMMADPVQIHQILMNLCTNAAYAMEDNGGTLSVRLLDETLEGKFTDANNDVATGHYLKLEVEDTGIGMSQTILDSIFEPYFTTKKSGEGTGLGLAVVHGIVKNYKGEIVVSSKPGRGSVFQVYLPAIQRNGFEMMRS
jgi:PAS domain S-box-containing protein